MLYLSVLLFFCAYETAPAQHGVSIKRTHPLNGNQFDTEISATGTLHIIAVIVEFQEDDNRFTSGNGTFDSGSLPYLQNNSITIDPLPHDRNYFEAHLQFAKNYFESVSGGQLEIDYRILSNSIRLDNKMEFYSPVGENFTNEPLALLARDVWQKVEQNGGFNTGNLDPDSTAFIIFHAGVGRDIKLTGTTLDKTPQDIPSIYLDRNSLGELLDDPSFEGFPINGGAFQIQNSLILPRTLSRRGENVDGSEFVLQLSTNGLLCATIGSHLGLPDLFNTRTGSSGIGQFGLMDGAGIFSYNGLFPPEPSAWEKTHLGWINPFTIDLASGNPVTLPAVSLRFNTLAAGKHEISGEEFFLVENRHRDPENDGATLTIRRSNGSEVQQEFTNNDETFVFQQEGFKDLFEPGVLIDMDNFDWSLPGGLDRGPDQIKGTPDDRFLNGGILIWHIDESVIRRELQDQAVNANPDRRGVDLEEADGAQDIGRSSQNLIVDRSNGSAFDFWWSGNDASVITEQGDTLTLYENRFGPDTHPNNNSNSGAPTFFEFFDFSDNEAVANFKTRRVAGDNISKRVLPVEKLPDAELFIPADESFLSRYPLGLSLYTAQNDSFLIVPTQNTAFAVRLNVPFGALFDFRMNAPQQPYIADHVILGEKPSNSDIAITAWQWDGNAWQNRWNTTGTSNTGFLSSISDNILLPDLTDDRFNITDGSQLPDLPSAELRTSTVNGQTGILTSNEFTIEGSSFSIPVNTQDTRIYTGAMEITQSRSIFYLIEGNRFFLIDPDASNPRRLVYESDPFEWPAFVDFDSDGRLDILYIDKTENLLKARNVNGGMLEFFPIEPPEKASFTGTPLVADLDGDGAPDLVTSVQDSVSMNLYAYDTQGTLKPGFPLFVGSVSDRKNRPVHPLLRGQSLFAVSHSGDLKAWSFDDLQDIRWGSRYGDEPFNKVTGRINSPVSPTEPSSILVDSETYNWPNPAGEETFIRYQTSGPGEVNLKVISISGRVIFEETYDATGGPPEEQRISTGNWGSGIYLAKITATVNGREASKLIKIAVVH